MCFSHAAPVILLPIVVIYHAFCGTAKDRGHSRFDVVGILQRHSVIPFPRLLRLSAFFGVLYLIADYFWFSSLQCLTVAAGAAVFNSLPLFVYCFSICLLHEKVSGKKLLGVLTAFVGVTTVVMDHDGEDEDVGSSSVVAGAMMMSAAAMNAFFEVKLAASVGDAMHDIPTLFTFSGLCGIFAIPPWIIGTIVFSNSPFPSLYEPFGLPATTEGAVMLTIAVVMFVINFVCLSLAVCWTSPLETSVGFMLTIPLSGIMDNLMHHTPFSWEFIVGSGLVMAGFCILESSSVKRSLRRKNSAIVL